MSTAFMKGIKLVLESGEKNENRRTSSKSTLFILYIVEDRVDSDVVDRVEDKQSRFR